MPADPWPLASALWRAGVADEASARAFAFAYSREQEKRSHRRQLRGAVRLARMRGRG